MLGLAIGALSYEGLCCIRVQYIGVVDESRTNVKYLTYKVRIRLRVGSWVRLKCVLRLGSGLKLGLQLIHELGIGAIHIQAH